MRVKLSRCGWSVGSRTRVQGPCGRRTVDGEHCAQHAKMARRVDEANEANRATFLQAIEAGRTALSQHEDGGEGGR